MLHRCIRTQSLRPAQFHGANNTNFSACSAANSITDSPISTKMLLTLSALLAEVSMCISPLSSEYWWASSNCTCLKEPGTNANDYTSCRCDAIHADLLRIMVDTCFHAVVVGVVYNAVIAGNFEHARVRGCEIKRPRKDPTMKH